MFQREQLKAQNVDLVVEHQRYLQFVHPKLDPAQMLEVHNLTSPSRSFCKNVISYSALLGICLYGACQERLVLNNYCSDPESF